VMRLSWTLVATAAYMALAFANDRVATILVPAYCFAVVVPYGIRWCERRWTRYRQSGEGPES
jgi:hypothetical protein